jgi:hypothetical protein
MNTKTIRHIPWFFALPLPSVAVPRSGDIGFPQVKGRSADRLQGRSGQ